MEYGTLGFPVLHRHAELVQTHAHWFSDPIISSSVTSISSCPQSFPASGFVPMSQLFASGGQIIWSFSFSISSSSEYSGLISFRIDWFDVFAVQVVSRVFSSTTIPKHQFSGTQLSLWAIFHIHAITTGKTITLTVWTFVGKVLFNMLSRFVIVFLQRTSVFNFMPGVIICSDFGAQKNKISVTVCTFPLLFAITWWDWMPWS